MTGTMPCKMQVYPPFVIRIDKHLHNVLECSKRGEWSRTYISELNNTHLSQIAKAAVSSIFVDNQGDVLHGFGTKPTSHDEIFVWELDLATKKVCWSINPMDTFFVQLL
jgi:hypothetical protein